MKTKSPHVKKTALIGTLRKTINSLLTPELFFIKIAVVGFAFLYPASSTKAATSYYWDTNGPTAGAGGATPSGLWEDPNWSTNSTGGTSTITNWVEGGFPRFAAGSDATG